MSNSGLLEHEIQVHLSMNFLSGKQLLLDDAEKSARSP